jgi:hypothetical protein
MKILTPIIVAALALSFAVSANAAGTKRTATAQQEASCKAEAAKKFSAIHFIKRSNFVNNCMARAEAKPLKSTTASKPAATTTGQSNK